MIETTSGGKHTCEICGVAWRGTHYCVNPTPIKTAYTEIAALRDRIEALEAQVRALSAAHGEEC